MLSNVSPTTMVAEMMAVPTIRPASTSTVVPGLRTTFRTAILNNMRLPMASNSTNSTVSSSTAASA